MYSVTKRIDFCYGHRLLDYDGICKHPHGHNAVAEIEVRTDALDTRNMVVDFSDIKRIVKGWIDRELDHKMILRHDDPLVKPLQSLGEPIFIVDSNPTVERIARLIYDVSREQGLSVVRVTVWETPTSWATYTAPDRLRSRRHPHRLLARPCRVDQRAAHGSWRPTATARRDHADDWRGRQGARQARARGGGHSGRSGGDFEIPHHLRPPAARHTPALPRHPGSRPRRASVTHA
jgi:6-pyruvoyltetrahydropterin/6-carboxytetrahydropterin synthase